MIMLKKPEDTAALKQKALDFIRPTDLKGVSSPFILIAQIFFNQGSYKEARTLLECISKDSTHYPAAITFKEHIYEQEIKALHEALERTQSQALKDMRELQLGGFMPLEAPQNYDWVVKLNPPSPSEKLELINTIAPPAEPVESENRAGKSIIFSKITKLQTALFSNTPPSDPLKPKP